MTALTPLPTDETPPRTRELFLAANVANSGGTLPYAWTKSPTAATDPHDAELWVSIAKTLERGKFHALFLGDIPHPLGRADTTLSKLEPNTLLARLAAETHNLGFATTLSSSLNDAFEIARKLHTLQRVSGERFAANIVTTAPLEPYQNFGLDEVPDRATRYAHAFQFVSDLHRYWQDISERRAERTGETRPNLYLLQAGGSDQGVDLAGKYATAVYASASTEQYAAEHRDRLRSRAVAHGRDPNRVLFVPGINVTLAETQHEAQARFDEFAGDFDSETATSQLAGLIGVDLAGLDPTQKIPDELLERALTGSDENVFSLAHRRSFITLIKELDEPLNAVIRRVDLNGTGHVTFIGTPDRLAEHIIRWFRSEAADGFIIRPQTVPEDLEFFVDQVVPILQRAGIFHGDYDTKVFDV